MAKVMVYIGVLPGGLEKQGFHLRFLAMQMPQTTGTYDPTKFTIQTGKCRRKMCLFAQT